MKDIFKFAFDFAKKIKETDEYKKLSVARKNNNLDIKLNEDIANYNKLTEKVKELISGGSSKEEIDSVNIKISDIYKKIMENENMIAFNKASDEVNIMMNKINSILIDAINENDSSHCSENEVFDCGSCGKCLKKN